MSATEQQTDQPPVVAALAHPRELTDDVVRDALDAAKERFSALEEKLEELLVARDNARREVQLLSQLLAVRQGTTDATMSGDSDASSAPRETAQPRIRRAARHPAALAAVRELEHAGKPLHISELMRLLGEKKVEIPGAGAQANLIAHLTRHPEVVRPSRGMYALAAWGASEQPPIKRADRKRVKGPSRNRK